MNWDLAPLDHAVLDPNICAAALGLYAWLLSDVTGLPRPNISLTMPAMKEGAMERFSLTADDLTRLLQELTAAGYIGGGRS